MEIYRFKPTQLIVPGALMAAGLTGVYALDDFKNSVRDKFSGYKKGHTFKADDYIQYTTAIGYLGLGFIPDIKCRSEFNDRLMAGITSYAVMAIAVNAMKYSFKHPRPGSGTKNSFPSGHSATVFTGAELMRIEYGNYIGLAGYAVAVTVGALRIYNDRHWITDVMGGAAIGILSARIGYWLLPFERKLFKLDKNTNKTLTVLPMIGETNRLNISLLY
ncbi:MAG: phosphatase PAP2 family protein [Muribaculaceae bacterium]|nr:phosphatase PAP2 family protein [Muribaculaceae bacterium]